MLTQEAKLELEKQGYRVVGNHSAVKTCGWTKTMIRGQGGCYKLKFYGIMSNQCLQMTTSISCANRCTFCWRGYKAPVATEWKWDNDDPEKIHKESLEAHHKLLIGFNGSDKANKTAYNKSRTVKHVALSLTGEPIFYPQINQSIDLFNKDGISTFLVTNGQYPEQIKDLHPITQLYISIDAPTKEMLKEVDVPLFKDFWERLHQSLDYLKEKQQRTAVRLTIIKNINDSHLDKYAELINRGQPDFIEVKAYMHVGPSQQRLSRKNMPLHEEVVSLTKQLSKHLEDYEIVSEHIPSRVVMLARKKFKVNNVWNTWIDFPKYDELVNSNQPFNAMDYCKKTPQVGLSGKGTIDNMPDHVKEKFFKENPNYVNENLAELEFYKAKKTD
ncbi:4-demethylwyosine synthase TYW1 [Candidatus Woesearchaeota archaeon]|jgi:tRNA wybutosine-synthesizing protein 1|nr:4-demethylwyosine synthase TYW1 [Candidatus Woesearchaeota archaeon]